ncbi:PilW family protein [Kaarinaea lacus]
MMTLRMQTIHKQNGLTLVEIMVAITISLILLAGVVKIFQSAKQSYNIQQALSRIQENARLMTDVMIRDITTSGYLGCLGSTNEVVNTLQDQTTNYDFATAIEGNEGNGNPDSIIIRRVSEATAIPVSEPMASLQSSLTLDASHMNYDSLQQWDVVTVSDCAGAAVFMITNDPDTDGVIEHAANVAATGGANTGQSNSTDDLQRIFGSHSASTAKIYRVGTTSYQVQPSSSGRPTSSLFVTPGGELVEGVEDLQIQYGLGSTPPNANTPAIAEQYVDADQVTDWNDVVSIRLTFVINSVDMVVNPGDGDGLLRKTFTSTVRLRNRAPA